MQIKFSQCTLRGNFFPLPLLKSEKPKNKKPVRVWLLILEGKRTVTAGSPYKSSLKGRFSNLVECSTLGVCQGHVKLRSEITKELFSYTEKLLLLFTSVPSILLDMKFCQEMNAANTIFK